MFRQTLPSIGLVLAGLLILPGSAVAEAPACVMAARLGLPGQARETEVERLTGDNAAALAFDLLPCLEDPDPAIRDSFAFETLSGLMRAGRLDPATLKMLKTRLLARLAEADGDPNGFRGPFAILTLSEIARTDRLSPWMSEAERSELVAAAAKYLAGLSDYRGFDDEEGWRHGVAHAADLLMQLSVHPQLTRSQGEAILEAIALKVAPEDHAYVFGESSRLAAPVVYLAQKEMFTEEEWSDWLSSLWPADDPLWRDVFGSEAALTKLHNLRAFADEVYISVVVTNEETYAPLAGPAFALMSTLP